MERDRDVHVGLVPVPIDVLRLLADWDLVAAGQRMGRAMPPDMLDQQWVWNAFAARTAARPADAFWFTQYLVVESERIVGDVRITAPPDDGVVMIGYHVVSVERRRGIATSAARELLQIAASRPEVLVVAALVNPANTASLSVCGRLGFTDVGQELHRHSGQMMRRLERPVRP